MHGGKRPGAGRKPGQPNRSKAEIKKDAAFKAFRAATREAARKQREEEADAKARERIAREEKRAEKRVERVTAEIIPALPDGIDCPADVEPLEFLKGLMRNPGLPLGFRRDCAALALPYAHAKPIMGLKDARLLAAYDDDGDDAVAAAMRA